MGNPRSTRLIVRAALHLRNLTNVVITSPYTSAATETVDSNTTIPTFRTALRWPDRIALTDQYGDHTYRRLFTSSKKLAFRITELLENKLQERVAFLCPNNVTYVLAQWACWMSGQIAVPLSSVHPLEMYEYFVGDSGSRILITTRQYEKKMRILSDKLKLPLVVIEDDLWKDDETTGTQSTKSLKGGLNLNLYAKLNAMILYTSGTTALPKGVVFNFNSISAQINSMITAWEWTANDSVLHCLPLHHVHGIMNALLTPLHCGARCLMLPKFNPKEVWNHLLASNSSRVTVLTGVPTMYVKLLDEYEQSFSKNLKLVDYVKATCSQKIRLMMCGSAPLPITVFDKWQQISGHRLLERYGMTEIGMALSNPINGTRKPDEVVSLEEHFTVISNFSQTNGSYSFEEIEVRCAIIKKLGLSHHSLMKDGRKVKIVHYFGIQGFVGIPMPDVNVRIVDNEEVLAEGNEFGTRVIKKDYKRREEQCIGELQVKGNTVFKEYWQKPEITKEEFTIDGWFKTGDTAQYVDSTYKILGRQSVDIIKSGGYKISAIFIESTLLQHPNIKDVAVIGLPDSTWGQKVIAIVALIEEEKNVVLAIKKWTSEKLPLYMVPSQWKIVPEIPRNAMGKINKKELIREMISSGHAGII